jgi:hypothetical protein
VWPTIGLRPGRPVVVPNVIVFHDNIGAFLYGFQPVFHINCATLFDLINENAIG